MDIFKASEVGDVGWIDELVKSGISVNSRGGDYYNRTPVMEAAAANQLEAAKFLFEKGCDLNLQDTIGWTAVHRAAEEGHADMAQLLGELGAELEIRDVSGQTAVNQAAAWGESAVVRVLANLGANLHTRPECIH